MLVKHYGPTDTVGQRRYSPSEFVNAEKRVINGKPDMTHISTSIVERQNLTMRMGMRCFTRLTIGFSKKVENLEQAVSSHFRHFNFARIHKSSRVTPAMEGALVNMCGALKKLQTLCLSQLQKSAELTNPEPLKLQSETLPVSAGCAKAHNVRCLPDAPEH